MKTSSTWVFLSTAALSSALLLTLGAVGAACGLAGCRSSTSGFGVGGASPASGSSGASNASSGSTSSGAGGSTSVPTVTIQQITNPQAQNHVGPGTTVALKGVVATSIKFLVEHSKSSNTCIWGAFFSAPGLTTAEANTGLLVVNDGTMAVGVDGGTAYCPTLQAGQPAGDVLPDDLQPGDVLDLSGTTDAYVPSTCSAADAGVGYSNVPAIQLTKLTSATRTSKGGPVPAPYVLTQTDLTTLAAGSSSSWLSAWGNVLVEADNVTAESQFGELFDAYGHMLLDVGTNGIEVGDGIYYVGDVRATDACYGGPYYKSVPPISFTAIRGFVYLDYCNWSLSPRDKCSDLNPPSADCAAVADAGPDPSAAFVCTHEPTDFIAVTDGG